MSTTAELVDIIVDLRMQVERKHAIIERLQSKISELINDEGQNIDDLVRENLELRERLEYYEDREESFEDRLVLNEDKGTTTFTHGSTPYFGVNVKYASKNMECDDTHNWG